MGQVVVLTNLSLDGVMQAPGHADEDSRGGFAHGGWATPFSAMQQPEAAAAFANMGALLFGRVTYQRFAAFWPTQTDNPFTVFLNNIPKYVASTTLKEPLPWSNSTLLNRDTSKTLKKLKAAQDKDFVVFGSGVLVQSLMRESLVDKFVLLIHPLVLGSGRRLFPPDGAFAALTLRDAETTANGLVIATYTPASIETDHAGMRGIP
jgi:dihydrofolate reductase